MHIRLKWNLLVFFIDYSSNCHGVTFLRKNVQTDAAVKAPQRVDHDFALERLTSSSLPRRRVAEGVSP
jgi:hypothetical protein